MKYKTFDFDIKAKKESDDEMTIEGYGAIFGNIDSWNDCIMKGAFSRTINNNKKRIKFLWQHKTCSPIGAIKEIYEDDKGLFIKVKICNTTKGAEAYELMKDGIINELSIGYSSIIEEYDKNKNIRYLKEVKLYEVSAVTWAANDKAKITDVKFEDVFNHIDFKNVSANKIKDAIKSLQALIDESDSLKSTQLINDSHSSNDTNSDTFIDSVLTRLKNM